MVVRRVTGNIRWLGWCPGHGLVGRMGQGQRMEVGWVPRWYSAIEWESPGMIGRDCLLSSGKVGEILGERFGLAGGSPEFRSCQATDMGPQGAGVPTLGWAWLPSWAQSHSRTGHARHCPSSEHGCHTGSPFLWVSVPQISCLLLFCLFVFLTNDINAQILWKFKLLFIVALHLIYRMFPLCEVAYPETDHGDPGLLVTPGVVALCDLRYCWPSYLKDEEARAQRSVTSQVVMFPVGRGVLTLIWLSPQYHLAPHWPEDRDVRSHPCPDVLGSNFLQVRPNIWPWTPSPGYSKSPGLPAGGDRWALGDSVGEGNGGILANVCALNPLTTGSDLAWLPKPHGYPVGLLD